MKHKIVYAILLAACFLSFAPVEAVAQDYNDPNNLPGWWVWSATPSNNKAYRGKIDTSTQINLGGMSTISLLVKCTDTMKTTVYVDYLQTGRTTWSAGYQDSVIAEKDTVQEILIRSSTLNRIPSFASKLRTRFVHHAATPEGTPSDYDSTTTYTQVWIWKP
jgi:hypothetical protein